MTLEETILNVILRSEATKNLVIRNGFTVKAKNLILRAVFAFGELRTLPEISRWVGFILAKSWM